MEPPSLGSYMVNFLSTSGIMMGDISIELGSLRLSDVMSDFWKAEMQCWPLTIRGEVGTNISMDSKTTVGTMWP